MRSLSLMKYKTLRRVWSVLGLCAMSIGGLGCSTTLPRSVMTPPVEPILLYQEPNPLPDLVEPVTENDLAGRIYELTGRYGSCLVNHRELSRWAMTEYQRYKRFYEQQEDTR